MLTGKKKHKLILTHDQVWNQPADSFIYNRIASTVTKINTVIFRINMYQSIVSEKVLANFFW